MRVVVPVEQMTNEQLESKAREVKAKGETEHATELLQFITVRRLVANHLLDLNFFEMRTVLESWRAKPDKGGR